MRFPLLFSLLLALAGAVRATTVVPPSFPELVAKADAIYRGRVTAVEARKVERTDAAGEVIKTFVTVAIERVLKGTEQSQVVLEFLGGTVGDEKLAIAGMPKFQVGQREIVFVRKNGVQFCPLVAMMHGRFHVTRDEAAGREFITRDNGVPMTDVSEVELPMHEVPAQLRAASAAAASAAALSPAAFEASIASQVQRPSLSARPN